jgi:hypothetical protein
MSTNAKFSSLAKLRKNLERFFLWQFLDKNVGAIRVKMFFYTISCTRLKRQILATNKTLHPLDKDKHQNIFSAIEFFAFFVCPYTMKRDHFSQFLGYDDSNL